MSSFRLKLRPLILLLCPENCNPSCSRPPSRKISVLFLKERNYFRPLDLLVSLPFRMSLTQPTKGTSRIHSKCLPSLFSLQKQRGFYEQMPRVLSSAPMLWCVCIKPHPTHNKEIMRCILKNLGWRNSSGFKREYTVLAEDPSSVSSTQTG